MSTATAGRDFSQIFLMELSAVEARRRRWRMAALEELDRGSSPSSSRIEGMPFLRVADFLTPPPAPVAREDLEKFGHEVGQRRTELERLRAEARPAPSADQETVRQSSLLLIQQEKEYRDLVNRWYRLAQAYRSEMYHNLLQCMKDFEKKTLRDEVSHILAWQRAERVENAAAEGVAAAGFTQSSPSSPPTASREIVSLLLQRVYRKEQSIARQADRLLAAQSQLTALEDQLKSEEQTLRECQQAKILSEKVNCARLRRSGAEAILLQAECNLAELEQLAYIHAKRVEDWALHRHSWVAAEKAIFLHCDRKGREARRARLDHIAARNGLSPVSTREEGKPENDGGDLLCRARARALDAEIVGMALSGGGIRSATFSLGVLQGLAQLRVLGCFDYLSTVSGGGYVGSWLAAWVRREGSLANVEKQLSPNRVSQASADRPPLPSNTVVDDEPEPVRHLREYSRYLSPRSGLFSLDTWTLVAIYLRNLNINALFFVPFMLALVLLWRLVVIWYAQPATEGFGDGWSALLSATALGDTLRSKGFVSFVGLSALFIATWVLISERENLFEAKMSRREPKAEKVKTIHRGLLFPLLIAALCGSWAFSVDPAPNNVFYGYDQAHLLRYFQQVEIEKALDMQQVLIGFAKAFTVMIAGLSIFVKFVRWLERVFRRQEWAFNWVGLFSDMVLGLFFGLCLFAVLHWGIWPLSYAEGLPQGGWAAFLLATLGVPLLFLAMAAAGLGEIALMGSAIDEFAREWRSRLAAHLFVGAVVWLFVAGATLFLPWAFTVGLDSLMNENGKATLQTGVVALWGAISGGGAWAARQGAGGNRKAPAWKRALVKIAPAVFLVGFLALISLLGQALIDKTAGEKGKVDLGPSLVRCLPWQPNWLAQPEPAGVPVLLLQDIQRAWMLGAPDRPLAPLLKVENWSHLTFPDRYLRHPYAAWLIFCASVGIVLIIGNRISVNRFSMHMLYSNRLVRCYLGASRAKPNWYRRVRPQRSELPLWGRGDSGAPTGVRTTPRQQNEFTGFDPLDDFPLAELRPLGPHRYAGPYPLINTALNRVAGKELAYQDRKADAFVLTPDHCGCPLTGYARTPAEPGECENLTLGRVTAVSGAAVDPNMGFAQSAPLTALMTLLNTRLGWWLERPRDQGWTACEPGFGWPLFDELLGRTVETTPYVHLSDGGHFENLGVYELIRRRCRFIVAVDVGTDRTAASDNMAAMLRLVRTDFGVRIDLDPSWLQAQGPDGYSRWHCAVGRIRYDEVDDQAVAGTLVYIQAGLTGDEPPDVLQYAARHTSFPRQSTIDQFFDEAQFECYRSLGHHVATRVFGEAAEEWSGPAGLGHDYRERARRLFAHLQRQWFPPPPCSENQWISAAQAAIDLERDLGRTPGLLDFNLSVYDEFTPPGTPRRQLRREIRELRAVNTTLQVMELAWHGMMLDDYYAHPLNRGWINTLRRWSGSPLFQRYWPVLRAEYSRDFVTFCERSLNFVPVRVSACRVLDVPAAPDQIDRATGRAALARLDELFLQEWSDDISPFPVLPARVRFTELMDAAYSDSAKWGYAPFVWLLFVRSGVSTLAAWPETPCGLVIAAESAFVNAIGNGADLEFTAWLRGPYRSLGLGSEAIPSILRTVRNECLLSPQNNGPQRLVAWYPQRGATAASRLDVDMWANFFFNLGFRRLRRTTGSIVDYLIVALDL